jgi:hypothetical protein
MVDFRKSATPATKYNYQGMLHTTWTGGDDFIEQFYGRKEVNTRRGGNYVKAFIALFDSMNMDGKIVYMNYSFCSSGMRIKS